MSDRATIHAALRHEQETLAARLQHLSVVDKVLQVLQTDTELATVREWLAGLAPLPTPAGNTAPAAPSGPARIETEMGGGVAAPRPVVAAAPARSIRRDPPTRKPPSAPKPAGRRAGGRVETAQGPTDLQRPVLAVVRSHANGVRLAEVCVRLQVPYANAFSLLKGLAKRGLIGRHAVDKNRWVAMPAPDWPPQVPAAIVRAPEAEFDVVPLPRASELLRSSAGGTTYRA